MNKFFYYNDLFSIYEELLTKKEREIFSSYYEENLSMGEIASNRHVSRSAIGHTIKTVEKKLEEYESFLHVAKKNEKIASLCDKITDEKIKRALEDLLK